MFHVGPTFFSSAVSAPTPSPTEVTPGTPAQLGSIVGYPLEFFYLTSTTALLQYQSTVTGQLHLVVVTNNGVTASVGTSINLGTLNATVVPLTATKALVVDDGGVVAMTPGYLRGFVVDLTTMALGTEYVLETNTLCGGKPSAVGLSSTKVLVRASLGSSGGYLVVDEAAGALTSNNLYTTSAFTAEGTLVRSGSANAASAPQGVGVAISGFSVTENPTNYPLTGYTGAVNRAVVQMEASGEFAVFKSDTGVLTAVRGALSGTVTTYSAEEDQAAADTPGFGAGEGVARISDTTIMRTFIVAGNGSTVFAQVHNFDGTITAPGLDVEVNALASSYPRAVRVSDLATLLVWNNTANNRIWYALCALT